MFIQATHVEQKGKKIKISNPDTMIWQGHTKP